MSGLGKSSASIQREREALPVSEKKKERKKKKKKSMDVLKQRQEQFYTLLKAYLGVVLTPPGLRKIFFFFPLKTKGGARVKLSLKQHPCQFCSVLGTRQGRNTSVEERGGCRNRRQGTIYDTTCM